jgi:hypothetical protein
LLSVIDQVWETPSVIGIPNLGEPVGLTDGEAVMPPAPRVIALPLIW